MENYFQGNWQHPRHVSAGAILLNGEGKICAHHFVSADLQDFQGYWPDEKVDDFYILMRSTLLPDQTVEEALQRGLLEEFGANGRILDYIGSINSHFKNKGVQVEKTTLYFICKLLSQDLSRRNDQDIEGKSRIEWQTASFLIPKMKEQSAKYGRTDIDESEILEKYLSLAHNPQ